MITCSSCMLRLLWRSAKGCSMALSASKQTARCIEESTILRTTRETSNTTSDCISTLTGAYPMRCAANGSIPYNCTTDLVLPSNQNTVESALRLRHVDPRSCHHDTLRRTHWMTRAQTPRPPNILPRSSNEEKE